MKFLSHDRKKKKCADAVESISMVCKNQLHCLAIFFLHNDERNYLHLTMADRAETTYGTKLNYLHLTMADRVETTYGTKLRNVNEGRRLFWEGGRGS